MSLRPSPNQYIPIHQNYPSLSMKLTIQKPPSIHSTIIPLETALSTYDIILKIALQLPILRRQYTLTNLLPLLELSTINHSALYSILTNSIHKSILKLPSILLSQLFISVNTSAMLHSILKIPIVRSQLSIFLNTSAMRSTIDPSALIRVLPMSHNTISTNN